MSLKRGKPGFKEALEEFQDGYVDAHYPNLTGYAFQAEMIDEDEGRKVMNRILKRIIEIEPDGAGGHPDFRLRGETNWRSAVDTDDFPQPTDEPLEEEEVEEEEEKKRGPRMLFNRRRR